MMALEKTIIFKEEKVARILVEPILYRQSRRNRSKDHTTHRPSSRLTKNYAVLPSISPEVRDQKLVDKKREDTLLANKIDLAVERKFEVLPCIKTDINNDSAVGVELDVSGDINIMKLKLAKVEQERDKAYLIINDFSRQGRKICTENDDLIEHTTLMEQQLAYLKDEFSCAKEIIDCLHHDNEVLKDLCNPESITKASLIFKEHGDENKLIPKPPTDTSRKRKTAIARKRRFSPKQKVETIKEETCEQ